MKFDPIDAGFSPLPEALQIPDGLEYLYMLWNLAKFYHISPAEAGKLSELDFWKMREMESLEQAKISYMMKLREITD